MAEEKLLQSTEGNAAPSASNPPKYFPQTQQVIVGYGSVQPLHRPVDPDMNTIYLSIFTMLFCCWPCGLLGLIYGLRGMQEHYRGEYVQSERTTKSAKKCAICSIVTGAVFIGVSIFLSIVSYAVAFGIAFSINKNVTTESPPTIPTLN